MSPNSVVRPHRERRGDNRSARLERVVLRLHGSVLLSMLLVTVLPIIGQRDEQSAPRIIARFVVAVVYLAIVIDLQRRGERASHLALLTVPVILGAWLQTTPIPGDVTGGLAILAFALSAIRLLQPWWYVACVPVAAVLYTGSRMVFGFTVTARLDGFLLAIGLTFAAGVFVDTLGSAVRESVTADARNLRRQRALQAEEAEQRAVDTAGRVLHDEVLAGLRLIADRSATTDRVRAACTAAIGSVDAAIEGTADGAVPTDHSSLVHSIQQAVPAQIELTVGAMFAETAMSGDQHAAVVRAVGEALRNMARHSGSATAEVRLAGTGSQLEIDVVDTGTGLPEPVRAGFGMSNSIIQPLRQCGGRAEFWPTPGGGTTVHITMPLGPVDDLPRLTQSYNSTVSAAGGTEPIRLIMWPLALVWTYLAVRYSLQWPHPVVPFLIGAGLVAATTGALWRLRIRAPSPGWVAASAGSLVLLDGMSLFLVPEGGLLDFRSWPVGYVAIPVMIIAFVLPVWLALLVIAPHPLLVLAAWQIDPTASSGAVPWGSLNATVTPPLVMVLLGVLLRRIDRTARREEDALAQASFELAVRRSADRVSSLHLDHTRRVVVPWLTEIADGAVDPNDDAVVEHARLLAQEVRDDLYNPGFFDEQLRNAVFGFRHRGGTLHVRPGFEPGASKRTVGLLLRHLTTTLAGGHTITVSPPHGHEPSDGLANDAGFVRLAVVPPVVADQSATVLPVLVDSDQFRTILAFPDLPAS